MKSRSIAVTFTTAAMLVGPALAHGVLGAAAGAKAECTIVGTAADDYLHGTSRDDVICTRAGNDSETWGMEGKDILRLGTGNDTGDGDEGNDVLKGGPDDDFLYGENQADRLYGGQGDDTGYGEDDNDFVKMRDNVSGNDTADGGVQTDTCVIDASDTAVSCEL